MSTANIGTVLVIEDEEPLRHAVCSLLRRRGFHVFEASEGNSGLQLFRLHGTAIDVILLDLHLPVVPGTAVLAELYRLQPAAKVILTTTSTPESASEELGNQRPWKFIQKPYPLRGLVEILREACRAQAG